VRDEVGDADGILEVRDRGDDWVQIAVWNPDGSLAEMSGNGTRIAARWLAERTSAAEVTVWVGAREVKARMLGDGLVEQTLGTVEVGEADEVEGIRFTLSTSGTSRRRRGRSCRPRPIGPPWSAPLSRPHERAGGTAGNGTIEARVWERGVGDRCVGHERHRGGRRRRDAVTCVSRRRLHVA
jgi:hypothetical protein